MQPGTRLGPYEVVGPLGAGGMGEVYRARDTRLVRDVAVKVLPDEVSADPRALARFESEARAVAALSHPNILALYDVGEAGGVHYAVTELLEGETLRAALRRGALPVRRALEISEQLAKGLAAAHEKRIVHRDVKPENVFLTKDGDAKLLDFGLARHTALSSDPDDTHSPTEPVLSTAGSVTGTVAYMSPEQARGLRLDHRSDQFSLGIVLYEMLTGRRPFRGDSAAETLISIIREEPEALEKAAPTVPAPVRFLVERLLTKEPEGRYDSTHDLVRELATWKLHSSSAGGEAGKAAPGAPGRTHRLALAAVSIALLAASAGGIFSWGKQAGRLPWPAFQRITLRRGDVTSARFTPDFQSVVYSASWEGKPAELFVQRLASADARPLGIGNVEYVAGVAGADVAVVQKRTLAQLPLEGGTPRDLLKDLSSAAWDRSGTRFAVVRRVRDRDRLEYPVGKVLVETKDDLAWIVSVRPSPDGTRVAFILHPTSDFSGDVCVVDLSGQQRTLSGGWLEIWSLAWSPDGKEVWFSAMKSGARLELHAVTLSGRERFVARLPGSIFIRDIASDGRVLFTYGHTRYELRGRMAGDTAERDLSWLDGILIPTIAPDGTQMVFQEWGEGGGVDSSTYHWRMDGSTPKRLGDGCPVDVSPDWTTVLVIAGVGDKQELKLVPIGAGETATLPRGPIGDYAWGFWLPDGKRIGFRGSDAEGRRRFFVQDVAGGLPRPVPHVIEFGGWCFSPDGRYMVGTPRKGAPYALFPLDGGEIRPIPFLRAEDRPVTFTDDGKFLFLATGTLPEHVLRLDLRTGTREPWLELSPPDRAGVENILSRHVTPNGRFHAYSYARNLTDLYLAEGLK